MAVMPYVLVAIAGLFAVGVGIYTATRRLWFYATASILALAGLCYLAFAFQSDEQFRAWPFTVITFIGMALIFLGSRQETKRRRERDGLG